MSPKVSFPLFVLFGLTRGMAGAGAGLLLADRIPAIHRRKVGTALLAVGAASTIPLMIAIVRRSRQRRTAGVMDPQTQVYTPSRGVVDAQEAEILPTGVPEIRP
jgi:hypothetical protein